jgi:hypothetical protein
MYADALWIQEIKSLFNSMKTLIIVLEFAIYSLELEIRFKKRIIFIYDLHSTLFFTMLAETQHFFLFGLIVFVAWSVSDIPVCYFVAWSVSDIPVCYFEAWSV